MQTYEQRSTAIALESSVAVFVLMGAPNDVEFLPLKPRMASAEMLAELKTRWPGRNLDSIAVIGLVGTTPKIALKEPLEPEQISALAGAFLAYVQVLFRDNFTQMEATELERLFSLPDTRFN